MKLNTLFPHFISVFSYLSHVDVCRREYGLCVTSYLYPSETRSHGLLLESSKKSLLTFVFPPVGYLSTACVRVIVLFSCLSHHLTHWLDYCHCLLFNHFPLVTNSLCHCSPYLIGCLATVSVLIVSPHVEWTSLSGFTPACYQSCPISPLYLPCVSVHLRPDRTSVFTSFSALYQVNRNLYPSFPFPSL